jgi:non-ribosomal peptide synthase protein (TIGR01720 family)/FkbM family methyltransferase
LQYLGRIDDQVKIRGFRIELGEIQQVLAQHRAIQDVVVVPHEFGPGDTRLVAYLTPHPRRAAPVRELMRLEQEHASQGLGRHELPNGMTVVHLNRNETDFLFGEVFEQESYLRHGITIEDNACVFDVGANIGLFTLFASQQARDVRVFAFEPIPPVFERLRANVQVHGVQAELLQAGAAGERGSAVFHYYPQVSILSGRFADAAHEREVVTRFVGNQTAPSGAPSDSSAALLDELIAERLKTVAVDCRLVRISDVMQQHQVEQIDVLKVDVEKSEWEVLCGIEPADWPKIRQVIVEVHDQDGRLPRIVDLLRAQGFSVTVEQDALLTGTDLHSVYGLRRTAGGQTPRGSSTPEAVWSSVNRIVAETRAIARRQLPEHMVPAAFVMLPSLPLTGNGKLDRRALPDVEPQRQDVDDTYAAPQSPAEQTLSAIWARVLKMPGIGVNDNFFELGGDSILSIQVIAAAHAQGLRLTPRQMFQHPTIAELAALAGTVPVAATAAASAPTGDVPLTPIQQWFFAQQLVSPEHFNQAVLLRSHVPFNQAAMAAAVRDVIDRHDALRLRFETSNREVRQTLPSAGGDDAAVVKTIDLSTVSDADTPQAIERAATESQQSLDLASGRLLRFSIFDGGAGRASHLLIVIHHLVVDGVSWRILLEDLYGVYSARVAGVAPPTRSKTTSFKDWSELLSRYAGSPELAGEATFWRERLPVRAVALPRDGAGENTVTATDRVVVALSPEETRQLLQDVPKAYGTQINDVLLTALSQSVVEWAGAAPVIIHLEGHGREPLFGDEVDLSRTVGWFTMFVPVVLDVDGGVNPGDGLKRMKEQLRQLPNRGIGYGILRYLSTDAGLRCEMASLPQAELSFNYQGQFDESGDAAWVRASNLSAGPNRAGGARRAHLIEIDGSVTDDALRLVWTFASGIHRRATIEKVAAQFTHSLRALIAHCVGGDAGGFTPSDFPSARLSQRQLDKLLSRLR